MDGYFLGHFGSNFDGLILKSVPRKVNISSVKGKLSQEPSKSSPSQKFSLRLKSTSRKIFRSFSETFFVASIERRRLATSFTQIQDENTKSGSFARLDGQNWIFSEQSVLLKNF